jgi:hypothetical protein
VAEPIAHAMSALHHIESTGGGGLSDGAPRALDAVRRALALLQSQPPTHPAVQQAMEAIASSLSLIHTLSQSAPPAQAAAFAGTVALNQPMHQHAPAPATQPSPAVAPQYGGYAQQPAPQNAAYPQQPNVQSPAAYAATAAQPQYGGAAYPPPPPVPGQWQNPAPVAAAPPPQQWQNPAPPQAPAPAWQQQPPAPAPAWQQQAPAPAAAAPAPNRGSQARGDGAIRVEAELGAHSSTNFYKGLSGNDVIDSGGIFIATYQIPEIGQDVLIRVSMPGGYEFEAVGIVRWTRDMPHSGADAPPGFGAQFTQISPEGRQLVYRYVRNREPLFHDDL